MNTIKSDAGVIRELLIAAGFNDRFSKWITAQSAHETGNFESPVYKENYNAFGMTYQGQKTALGEKNGFAYYNSYAESVADYLRLYKSYGVVIAGTVEGFVETLKKKGYFTAPVAEYAKGMRHFLKLYFSE